MPTPQNPPHFLKQELSRRHFMATTGLAALSVWTSLNLLNSSSSIACPHQDDNTHPTISRIQLPYQYNDLQPYISEQTVRLHYDKHHQNYLLKLKWLLKEHQIREIDLITLIKQTYKEINTETDLFNHAAQVYNHNFYWQSIKKDGGGKPQGSLLIPIEQSFGTFEKFIQEISSAATSCFGSGWIWLVQDDTKLKIISTPNAIPPLVFDMNPLICIDIWEHAYYLDYQNLRRTYVDHFFHSLVNWNFAIQNFIL